MGGNFFACQNRMTARIWHLPVTAMTRSTADGCQTDNPRWRWAIVAEIGGGKTSEQGGVARFRLALHPAKLHRWEPYF